MPENLRPPRGRKPNGPPEFFRVVYWVFFSSVFVLLGILLFKPLFASAPYWVVYIQHIALAVVAVCFGFWIGDIALYLKIPSDVRKAVFTTFIVVILTAASSYIVALWRPPPVPPDLPKVAMRVSLLNEDLLAEVGGKFAAKAIEPRQNRNFIFNENERLRIFLAMVVSNFNVDLRGNNDIEVTIIFNAGGSSVGDVYRLPQTDPNDWKGYPIAATLTPKVVAESLKLGENETLFLMQLRIEKEALSKGSKTGDLRLLVKDKKSGFADESTIPLTLQPAV